MVPTLVIEPGAVVLDRIQELTNCGLCGHTPYYQSFRVPDTHDVESNYTSISVRVCCVLRHRVPACRYSSKT